MGFHKTAHASVITPAITWKGWRDIRSRSTQGAIDFGSRKATQAVLGAFDPASYMLSHCTIVASVDTEAQDGDDLGKIFFEGQEIDRRYPDYLVTVPTSQYINNNFDAFERKLLLASFKTFVGGENYVEHVQLPELSKGKIIDAAARDIGDSIYIDILVATHRKHADLVRSIGAREMTTLSMGCQVQYTICSRCGNVAEDELQMCNHIRFMKGNTFIDDLGRKRKIAELCGHIATGPGSVRFIEASWVRNPAFTGAVLRNILDDTEAAAMGLKLQEAFSMPKALDPKAIQRAARLDNREPVGPSFSAFPRLSLNSTRPEAQARRLARKFLAEQEPFGESAPSKEESPLKKIKEDLKRTLVEDVAEGVRDQIDGEEAEKVRRPVDENENENLIRSAMGTPEWQERAASLARTVKNPKHLQNILAGLILYQAGGWTRVATAQLLTGPEVLAVSRIVDSRSRKATMSGEARIYRTVLAVGGYSGDTREDAYLQACRRVIGRNLTETEKIQLVFKGRLFSIGI